MKSILVIGMGRFGMHLAEKFQDLKNDVMIIDKNEDIVERLSSRFNDAQIGDCTNFEMLKSLGVNNFDICFVTMGKNFEASLIATTLLKELGAKKVIVKAGSDIQVKLLKNNGADEVVYPERQMAEKVAIKYNVQNVFDYIELTPEISVFEIDVLASWIGRTVSDVNVRRKYNINILAIKSEDSFMPLPGADYLFQEGDHMVIVGRPNDVFKLTSRQ